MQKIQTIVAIALMTLATLTGCSKKSDNSTAYSMKATVGSTSFNATNCVAAVSGGGLIITGWNGSSAAAIPPQIVISIITWGGSTSTTTFDSLALTGFEEYVPNTTVASVSKTGTAKITAVSATFISGTFSFTGGDGTVVSNGSFTAKR